MGNKATNNEKSYHSNNVPHMQQIICLKGSCDFIAVISEDSLKSDYCSDKFRACHKVGGVFEKSPLRVC